MPVKPAVTQACNTQSCQECSSGWMQRIDAGCTDSTWIWDGAPGASGGYLGSFSGVPGSISVGGYIYWPSGCNSSSNYCEAGYDPDTGQTIYETRCSYYSLCRRPA